MGPWVGFFLPRGFFLASLSRSVVCFIFVLLLFLSLLRNVGGTFPASHFSLLYRVWLRLNMQVPTAKAPTLYLLLSFNTLNTTPNNPPPDHEAKPIAPNPSLTDFVRDWRQCPTCFGN
jgi:hypothetical protein